MITVFLTTQGDGHGAEAVLCEMLAAWPMNGLPLRIAAPQGSRVLACAAECGMALLPLAAGRDALVVNARAIRKALRGVNDISLVHAWSARSLEFAWLLKHRLGVPASGTLHDHPSACFHGVCRRLLLRASANRLDGIVAVSEAVSSAVKSEAWSVPVSVIRNGLSSSPSMIPVKKESQELRIGFPGMYTPWKGAALIADWIGRQGIPDGVVWTLYGTPSPSVQEQFKPLIVRWPGRVRIEGRQVVREIFRQIDILVHASTQFDPLPTVLIEAARAGIPCVASCLGGSAEIVEDKVTGFLFNPAQPGAGLDALLIGICFLACRESGGSGGGFQGGSRSETGRHPPHGRPPGDGRGVPSVLRTWPCGWGGGDQLPAGGRGSFEGASTRWADRTPQRGAILPTESSLD